MGLNWFASRGLVPGVSSAINWLVGVVLVHMSRSTVRFCWLVEKELVRRHGFVFGS